MRVHGRDIVNAVSAMERAAQTIRASMPKTNEAITLYVDLECSASRLKTGLGMIDVEIKEGAN